jgi:hypothetical protein
VPNAGVEEGVPKREDEDWAPNMVMCDGGRWDVIQSCEIKRRA